MLKLTFDIVKGDKPNLLRRDCLSKLRLNWGELFSMNLNIKKVRETFHEELRTMKNEKAKIYLKPNNNPKFLKARPLPYLLKEKN